MSNWVQTKVTPGESSPEGGLKVHNRKRLEEPNLTRKNIPAVLWDALYDNKIPVIGVVIS